MPSDGFAEIIRTHLELRSPGELRPSKRPQLGACITRLEQPSAAEYIALYSRIGGPWHWRDRLAWSESELDAYLRSADVRIFTLEVLGERAGYFELKGHDDGSIEIMYFGLDQRFMGQGLGGWMLTRTAEEAFALGAKRVILNTCTLDAPQALPNYLARGFVITREERYRVPSASTRPTASGATTP